MSVIHQRDKSTIHPMPDIRHERRGNGRPLDSDPSEAAASLVSPLRALLRHACCGHVGAVRLLVDVQADLDDRIAAAVITAHRAGASWQSLAQALGTNPRSASARYGEAAYARRHPYASTPTNPTTPVVDPNLGSTTRRRCPACSNTFEATHPNQIYCALTCQQRGARERERSRRDRRQAAS